VAGRQLVIAVSALSFVIPAYAGIQPLLLLGKLDPGIRRDDEQMQCANLLDTK
jgi:hypothetical protein